MSAVARANHGSFRPHWKEGRAEERYDGRLIPFPLVITLLVSLDRLSALWYQRIVIESSESCHEAPHIKPIAILFHPFIQITAGAKDEGSKYPVNCI